MKKIKVQFWLLLTLGVLGIVSSLISFLSGASFGEYYFGGFCGIILIGQSIIDKNNTM